MHELTEGNTDIPIWRIQKSYFDYLKKGSLEMEVG
jgi:hypothetical protein